MRVAQQDAHLIGAGEHVEAQHELGVGGGPGATTGGQCESRGGVGEACESVFGEDVDCGAVAG